MVWWRRDGPPFTMIARTAPSGVDADKWVNGRGVQALLSTPRQIDNQIVSRLSVGPFPRGRAPKA
jgi:hypothetical protein